MRGWNSWLDDDQAWEEQAAEIIVWALSDQPVLVFKIDQNSCDELHDGYVALTGLDPLHGYTKFCAPSVVQSQRS